MPYDVTLGGQNFAVDNPNQILGMLDNFLKIQMAQQLQQKQQGEKQSLLQTLQGYNLSPADQPPQSFEELGSRYQGTTGEYDQGGHPIPKFSSGQKPQVTNLRQLVDVIQGMKGLPPEYASEIIGRLTGIADPSVQQNEKLLKLKSELLKPHQEEVTRLKEESLAQKKQSDEEKLTQQKDMTIKKLKATYLAQIIKNSPSAAERKSATEEWMKLLFSGEGDTPSGEVPAPPTKQPSISNFRERK